MIFFFCYLYKQNEKKKKKQSVSFTKLALHFFSEYAFQRIFEL